MVGPRRIKIGIITASIASQCELLRLSICIAFVDMSGLPKEGNDQGYAITRLQSWQAKVVYPAGSACLRQQAMRIFMLSMFTEGRAEAEELK